MPESKPRLSADRVLRAAARIVGRVGYAGASIAAIARDAGASPREVRRAFTSKAELVMQAQRAAFHQMYQRFEERARRGERGLGSALDALDAMWLSVRELHPGAQFVTEVLAMSSQDGPVGEQLREFTRESTVLLEEGIRRTFAEQLGALALPPGRMAVVIRVLLEGLAVELARARTAQELAVVDQAYADMRELFRRFVLTPEAGPVDAEPLPLPW